MTQIADIFAPIQPTQIKVGSPVPYDIYNKDKKLLLSKDKIIISDKQLTILLNNGEFRIDFPGTERSIQDLTGLFKIKLAAAFELLEAEQDDAFVMSINRLALDIQEHCLVRPDALLGALYADRASDYYLIHPIHCAAMCEVVAKAMSMPILDRVNLLCAALTQNIGYYQEQGQLLSKESALSPAEKALIKDHPLRSYQYLVNAGVNNLTWLETVMNHHELLDGSGYPHGTRLAVYPLHRQVLALADTFAASTRWQAYSAESVPIDVMRELLSLSGKCASNSTTNMFVKQIGAYPNGSNVQLSNNEIAIVIRQGEETKSPVVAAIIDAQGISLKQPITRHCSQSAYSISKILPFEQYKKFDRWISQVWPRFSM
jgi:HD-GYP domain-containing protein (c-di-GMP phosphodiesterase class II)